MQCYPTLHNKPSKPTIGFPPVNAGWTRSSRNNPGSLDHGNSVRRLSGGWCHPGLLPPLLAATIGALVTTWTTFTPCFLWIFLGGPYIEKLRGNEALTTTLSAVTAAVVGVVLNLAVWFSLHVIFPGDGTVDLFAHTRRRRCILRNGPLEMGYGSRSAYRGFCRPDLQDIIKLLSLMRPLRTGRSGVSSR